MSTPSDRPLSLVEQFAHRAQALADDAKAADVVVTIEERPLQPLRMGNVEMVAVAWPARKPHPDAEAR